jgi:glycosyltransferase involved in cell wall biosynthesis
MPLAVEQLDLSAYDLVLTSSHAFAKGVLTGPAQLHVAYVHAPMRWAWEYQHQYLRESGLDRGLRGVATRLLLHRLRQWDRGSGLSPDVMLANSRFIQARIEKIYRRPSTVLHPPVALGELAPVPNKAEHYLAVGRFVPYKRTEMIVRAFAQLPERRLVVIGDGPGRKGLSVPGNVELLGRVSREELCRHLALARALVFAAEEDFGITLVEAHAAGTPVIAYGRGGARDIVVPAPQPGATGVFFDRQDEAGVIAGIRAFEAVEATIAPADLIARAALPGNSGSSSAR